MYVIKIKNRRKKLYYTVAVVSWRSGAGENVEEQKGYGKKLLVRDCTRRLRIIIIYIMCVHCFIILHTINGEMTIYFFFCKRILHIHIVMCP